jgi:hypothetical protein
MFGKSTPIIKQENEFPFRPSGRKTNPTRDRERFRCRDDNGAEHLAAREHYKEITRR